MASNTQRHLPVDTESLDDGQLAAFVATVLGSAPENHQRLRNLYFLPALKCGALARAKAVNDVIVKTMPEVALYWSDRTAVALRLGDPALAGGAADRLLRLAPDDAKAQAQALKTYLASDRVEVAAALARKLKPRWASQPVLAHLSLLALGRAGDRSAAAAAAEAVVATLPNDIHAIGAAAEAFLQVGRPKAAIAALRAAGVTEKQDARAWFELARALHALKADLSAALAACQRAMQLDPKNQRALALAARILIDLARPADAAKLLATVPEADRSPTIDAMLVEIEILGNRFDQAATHARKLLDRGCDNFALTRRMTGVLQRAGHAALARDYYERNRALRAARLPNRFADGVARIVRGDGWEMPELPQSRLDWLFARLAATGCAPPDRARWEASTRNIAALDSYMLDWIECRPEAISEVLPFLEGFDAACRKITDAQRPGEGVFLATAHVGLLFGSLAALACSGLPMSFVASVPNLGHSAFAGQLISTSGQAEAQTGREIFRAIRSGKSVAIAPDGASISQKTDVAIFGHSIQVSSFVPKLAWKTGTPSLFASAAWRDGRAHLQVDSLPNPHDFLSIDTYTNAWANAFAALVEQRIRSDPDSARAFGGFWSGIAQGSDKVTQEFPG